jgi:hypothetical protein
MSYNGYANEATYTTSLLVDNDHPVHDAMRAILHKSRDAQRAAPLLRALVHNTLAGRNRLLSPDLQKTWRADIRRSGGLAAVDWLNLAESEMDVGSGILPASDWGLHRSRGLMLGRTGDRAARRAGRR